MENIIRYASSVLWILLGLTLIVKSIYFYNWKSERWKFSHFVFFKQESIHTTKSRRRVRRKRIQNLLSILFILLFLVQLAVAAIENSYYPVKDNKVEAQKEARAIFR